MCEREGGNVYGWEVRDGEGSREGSRETGGGAKGRVHVWSCEGV